MDKPICLCTSKSAATKIKKYTSDKIHIWYKRRTRIYNINDKEIETMTIDIDVSDVKEYVHHEYDTEIFCLGYVRKTLDPSIPIFIHSISQLHMCVYCTNVVFKCKYGFRIMSHSNNDCVHCNGKLYKNFWSDSNKKLDLIKV